MFTFAASTLAQEFDVPDEAEAYEAYLKSLEGLRLNINKTPQSDFLELPGLTPDLAWRIVSFRPYQKIQPGLQRMVQSRAPRTDTRGLRS